MCGARQLPPLDYLRGVEFSRSSFNDVTMLEIRMRFRNCGDLPVSTDFIYDAFISYNQQQDKPLVRRLQRQLQNLGKAWWQRRVVRVFRDESSLSASPELWPAIERALAASRYLIVCASPEAAASHWVDKEVCWWLQNRGRDTLLIALTAGDIQWNSAANDFVWNEATPLPPAFKCAFNYEPKWTDFRAYRALAESDSTDDAFLRITADLSSAIRGIPKEDLLSEEMRQQRRALRMAYAAAGSLAALLLISIFASWYAVNRLRDAYLTQAITLRGTLDPERRSKSLALLAKATNLRLLVGAAKLRVTNDLRDEAVAAMALVELKNPRVWNGLPLGTKGIGFNSNLELYARGDAQGNISIRRIVDDHELMHLPGFGSDPRVLRFSPDDNYLAAKYDGDQRKDQLYVWDLSRPGTGPKYLGTTCNTAFDFDPRSQVLAVARCDGSGSIDMFDLGLTTSMPTKSLKQTAIPQFIAFRPDGRQLAVSSGGQPAVQVLELNQGKAVLSVSIPTGVTGIAWNADGGILAAAADDHRIYVWDVSKLTQGSNSPELLQVLTGHQAEVTQVSFSAPNNLLASTAWDETVRIWEPISGKELIRAAGSGPMQFSADGRRLAFIAGTQQLVRWEFAAPSEYHVLRSHEAPRLKGPWSADFSPDGRLLASAHGDGLRIWDLSDNKELALVDQAADGDRLGYTRSVLFQPNGTGLITCGPGDEGVPGGLYIWPIESQSGGIANALRVRKSRKIDLPKGALCEWATLDDKGRTLLVADGRNGQVLLRDLNHSAEWTLLPAVPGVEFVATHPDDRWIAYGKWKLGIWAMDLRTKNTIELERSSVSFFAVFSPNGKWLVTGSPDHYRVWEVGSWAKPIYVLPGFHGIAGIVGPFAFSPNGTILAIARSSSEVELLDANKGWEKLVTLKSPDDLAILNWLKFSADGSQLAVVTQAHSIYIWDLRAIRTQLAGMHLDWELPPYPSSQAMLARGQPVR
jgi:WD40 repeat protein